MSRTPRSVSSAFCYDRADPAQFKNIPHELTSYKFWVVWEERPPDNPENPKWKKIALDPLTLVALDWNNPRHWSDRATAVEVFNRTDKLRGIGWVPSACDPFGYFDLDHVIVNDTLESWAAEFIALANSYTEISAYHDGLKIIARLTLPEDSGCVYKFKDSAGIVHDIEMYSQNHWFAATGQHYAGTPWDIRDAQHILSTNGSRVPKTPEPDKPKKRWPVLVSFAAILRAQGVQPRQIYDELRPLNERLSKQAAKTPYPDKKLRDLAKWFEKKEPGIGREPGDEEVVASDADDFELDLVPLTDIQAENQEWLWEDRIPRDELTNLSGDMDKGKSLLLYYFLTLISNGGDFPDGAKNPFDGVGQKCLLIFSEGSLERTVKPRMMVMGANMANILTMKSVSRKGEKSKSKRQFYLDTDLRLLREKLIQHPDIKLVGFDPVTNHIGDSCNMMRSQEIRRVLTPLQELAEEMHVTIIAVIHFNKTTAMQAIHRTSGAAALVEIPRAAWACLDDDDPLNKGGFVFSRIKMNVGERVGGLCYRIDKTYIDIKGKPSKQPLLVWGKPTDKTADDLLAAQDDPAAKGLSKAQVWLEKTFSDGLARPSHRVFAVALKNGISDNVLKKARKAMRVQSQQLYRDGVTRWYMRKMQPASNLWAVSGDLDANLDDEIAASREPE